MIKMKYCSYCKRVHKDSEPMTLVHHELWACRQCMKNIETHG